MTIWKHGDPYPEYWPQWLKLADIYWCDVEVSESGDVIWKNGTWESGTWKRGTWKSGTWQHGVWYDGTWESGTWGGGNWMKGVWKDGHWVSGDWYSGSWEDGAWEQGTWHAGVWGGGVWCDGVWLKGDWHAGVWQDGTWHAGVWWNGTWNSGDWYSGIWKKGHQKKPRFGWELCDKEGDVLGLIDGDFEVKTREEWEPLLKDMDPQKVLEYETLVTWDEKRRALNRAHPTGPSLWDHIIEEEL